VIEVPVFIVGGGPVGLTTSILLSRFGIRSLLVERHPGTSVHPKARAISVRTMEIFRQCALEQPIREAGVLPGEPPLVGWGQTLTDPQLKLQPITTLAPEAERAVSPTVGCGCPQDVLESVLLQHARGYEHADIRFGHELLGFERTACGVNATIRGHSSDMVTRVHAQYMVGADGAHSTVRDLLGIQMDGPENVSRALSMLFRADLTPYVKDRPILLCMIRNPDAPGLLAWTGTDGRWCFNMHFPEDAELEDVSSERAMELIRAAVGVPVLPVEILSCAPFISSARVAQSYRRGRVFLAGDAAHEMTPAGGHGMNTGIQDAHNLVWKLAAVIDGYADALLLETYERERQPVGQWVTRWSLESFQSIWRDAPQSKQNVPAAVSPPGTLTEQGIVFGVSYRSMAVVPDGTQPLVLRNLVTDYVPDARPGSRAPHVWLEHNRERISTMDLFGNDWVLLGGEGGETWCHAADSIRKSLNVPIRAWRIGAAGVLTDPNQAWASTYGVDSNGAVLIRPDGHVAWRSRGAVPAQAAVLGNVLARVMGRSTPEFGCPGRSHG
jgi:2-polyprenyl-6-methoxyphenol hydroxylase-like FAD-dependent oxidoreductase